MPTKRICLFGTYESRFPRTITLKTAANIKGYELIECHIPHWELTREKQVDFSLKSIIPFLFKLTTVQIRLLFKYLRTPAHDVIIVGYNGYFDMPLAKILAKIKRRPLVYTPVFPLYETLVEDRKYVNRDSFKSRLIHRIDEMGCRLADLIILETETYIEYYCREFGIPREKFHKIPLGADETTFSPGDPAGLPTGRTHVLFYGKFIPLQGIPYIVRAAKLLENDPDITFKIIGSGQQSTEVHDLAKELDVKNIDFIDWIDYKELPGHILAADICLGIFGDTPKARRGIPIKVYEALAMRKPVITGNTPAAREVFVSGENAVLCEMSDPESLAKAIGLLKRDGSLRERISENGNELYHQLFSSGRIAERLEEALKYICHEGIHD